MKAAVLHKSGTIPKYEEFSVPTPENEEQVLLTVKASSIKQLDKLKVSGKHYTSFPSFPTTVGVDGAGILENGKRVYATGITGMIAEKALIKKDNWTELPDSLDFETAAALPNALIGSDMALLYRAKIKTGEVLLINGATGITGKIAVQAAKYRGASKIIVTGRDAESLQYLKELGADETISLKDNDETIINRLTELYKQTPFDIILDYIWGHPAELILSSLKEMKSHPVRIVTIGEMAGATIPLPSSLLRSKPIEILGSGIGSLRQEDFSHYTSTVLPEMFQLAAKGKLKIDIETVELKDIEAAWQKNSDSRKRTVVKI